MKYLFFDLEFATSKDGNIKICEFGYVLTDENFKILDKDNMIVNPNIDKDEWDRRVVRKILTRTVYEYEKNEKFNYYYDDIVKLITEADYIFGHTLNGDVKALNCECDRYNLPSIDFKFYDISEIYKKYSGNKENLSVTKICKELEIDAKEGDHDAETDAYNTMLDFKGILNKLEISVEELFELCGEDISDYNENYKVHSIEMSEAKQKEEMDNVVKGNGNNLIVRNSKEDKVFSAFLSNVYETKSEDKTLNELKVTISSNYEEKNFKQMLNIVQILCNKGASYVKKVSECDVFVKFNNEDDIECQRTKYAMKNGDSIKIIDFDEFLKMLDLTREELDGSPMVSFECLYRDDAKIDDKKIKKYFQRTKKELVTVPFEEHSAKLGDLCPNLYEFRRKLLEEEDK